MRNIEDQQRPRWRQTADISRRGVHRYVEDLKISMDELDNKDTVILDIGSGSAQTFAREMKERKFNAKVISVEPRLGDAQETEKQSELVAVAAIGQQLPFESESVECVYAMWSVPYYVEGKDEIVKIVREMLRVVKPGGTLRAFPIEPEQKPVIEKMLEGEPSLSYSLETDDPLDGDEDWLLVVKKEDKK